MDQDKAQVLFEQGAILLLLDFPEGSEFGIDCMSWNVGPNFKGVKMIPPGVHFVYYSAVNSFGQTGPRSGFFLNFSPKEVVVKHWDPRMEDIKSEMVTSEEQKLYESNKQDMDRFLGPYPYEKYKQWVSLSSRITEDVINILQPTCGFIYSVAQFESEMSTTQSRQAQSAKESDRMDSSTSQPNKEVNILPDLKTVAGTTIKYSEIPKTKYPIGSTPAQITKYSMDSSYTLEKLLEDRFEKDIEKLLGEVQFAFVCFLLGQSYDSFEQWKKLVHLLCTCGDAATVYTEPFISFITILHFQIREIPSEFFVDIVTSNNFLVSTLHELFQNLSNESVDARLRKKGRDFQKYLTGKFKWDFSSEPDEYAPVVVDC